MDTNNNSVRLDLKLPLKTLCSEVLSSKECQISSSERTVDSEDTLTDSSETNGPEDVLEPIAVIGLSIRFPKDATSPESFWNMLMEGRSAMSEIPKDRFNIDAFHRHGVSRTGILNARGGHFVKENIAAFDAPFFTMTPTEAETMDPMQRWLLEVAYEALENAGLPIHGIAGSKTSVHIGAFLREYEFLLSRDPQMKARYKASGTAFAMLANRLSWFFDFNGPSIAIDTACSSSLYALHNACQGLRAGDSTMSIVGGCNLFYNPDSMTELTDLNFLSPDSTCYSFDHRANGYSRGEGFGVVVLKTITEAIRCGDVIRAVIRSSGVNQDGRTPGITQPSSRAQHALIQDTYARAGLDMAQTRYFEAHGTGTLIGDPLEAHAIYTAFRDSSTIGSPLYVGALKSNIGHLEGAAGIAGLIKAILVLENGIIPPNINFEKTNPKIFAKKWNIEFPTKAVPWPTGGLRRASVNSFGFGGSNAHVVLDDAYHYLKQRQISGKHCTIQVPPTPDLSSTNIISLSESNQSIAELAHNPDRPRLLVWSAAEQSGLERLCEVYLRHLRDIPAKRAPDYLANLAYTLGEKRSNLPWKGYLVANTIEELLIKLEKGIPAPIRSGRTPNIGYIFTGQGAQWHAMGRELLVFHCFRDIINEAENAFHEFGCSWNLTEELHKDEKATRLSEPLISQPICTAIQIALVELLKSWNIMPSLVIGHSSGEIAAAYTVGGLSRLSSWKVAYYRGVVSQSLKESGGEKMCMASVGLSESDTREFLTQYGIRNEQVTVACINSNKNVTLSGSLEILDMICSRLQGKNIFARKLKVDVAYHSTFMSTISGEYELLLGTLSGGINCADGPHMYSSVTGEAISPVKLSQAQYWVSNMVSPVQFFQAVDKAVTVGHITGGVHRKNGKRGAQLEWLIEIGPHSALQGPLKDTLSLISRGKTINYNSVLIRQQSAMSTALHLAGLLYTRGCALDMASINTDSAGKDINSLLTDLPAYPFNHTKSHWLESRLSKNFRFRKYAHCELLGSTVPDWNPQTPRWRNLISLEDHPWVKDHNINGLYVYPAAGMLVMPLEAIYQLSDQKEHVTGYRLKDITVKAAIVLKSEDDIIETELQLSPIMDHMAGFLQWFTFKLFKYEQDSCIEACSGLVALEYEDIGDDTVCNESQRNARLFHLQTSHKIGISQCLEPVCSATMYDYLSNSGFKYGPTFATLKNIYCGSSNNASAEMKLDDWNSNPLEGDIRPCVIHPAALDSILHLGIVALSSGGKDRIATVVPSTFPEVWLSNRMSDSKSNIKTHDKLVQIHSKAVATDNRHCSVAVSVIDLASGTPSISLSFEATSVTNIDNDHMVRSTEKLLAYKLEWRPDLDFFDGPQVAKYCTSQIDETRFLPSSHFLKDQKHIYCTLILSRVSECLNKEKRLEHNFTIEKYLAWMEHRLSEEQLAPEMSPSRLRALSADTEYINHLEATVEQCDAEGRLMVRVGQSLLGILQGTVDVIEHLFKDDLMTEYYRHGNSVYKTISLLKIYIVTLSHKNPGMNILEVGAGTGSATSDVLQALTEQQNNEKASANFEKYSFTDISPAFFKEAQEKFNSHEDRLQFSILDISKDPTTQGFKSGSHDLIIASNVLHATPDLLITLKNVRKLLKPGGKLVLYEFIKPDSISHGFIFGLLSGWWLSSEPVRAWSPLIPEKLWSDFLSKSGFGGIDFALRDFDGENHTISAMVATASLEDSPDCLQSSNGICIIQPDNSAPQNFFATALKNEFFEAGLKDTIITTLSEVKKPHLSTMTSILLPGCEKLLQPNSITEDFAKIQEMICSSSRILWVTQENADSEQNPVEGMLHGLRRVISREQPNLHFAILALTGETLSFSSVEVNYVHHVLRRLLSNDNWEQDLEYRVEGGALCVPRLVQASSINNFLAERNTEPSLESTTLRKEHPRALKFELEANNFLDGAHFEDDSTINNQLAGTEIEIKVGASGLNYRDIHVALGHESQSQIGMECAGVVSRKGANATFNIGERVCAIVDGSLSTFARCEEDCAVQIPENITLQQAAAIPISFSTAYYSIVNIAKLQQGETILIHSAAGALGQACIQISKMYKAKIFATVGSAEKKRLLVNVHGIPEERIYSSRNADFVYGIKSSTEDRGVDVVINSLSGEGLRSSWECIAPFGRFVETSLKDVIRHKSIPLAQFSKMATFSAVGLIYLKTHSGSVINQVLRSVMALLSKGKIKIQTPLQVYSLGEVDKGLRLIQSGKSMGKIVIDFGEDDEIQARPSLSPKYQFSSDATYVIAGGLGGLGKSIGSWMVQRGAKNLLILSRSGAKTDSQQNFLETLRTQGINVVVAKCDITNAEAMSISLEESTSNMPPIKGCIQSTMVLKDSRFDTMDQGIYNTATSPKVTGSWNLHVLLPKNLDFFILLSSSTGIVGWHGQSNYASGNTYQDTLARHLTTKNIRKAVAIDLGGFNSAGYVATKDGLAEQLELQGFIMSEQKDLHRILEYYCNPELEMISGLQAQLITGIDTPANLRAKGIDIPSWMYPPMFSHLFQISSQTTSYSKESSTLDDFSQKITTMTSLGEVEHEIVEAIALKLARTLAIDVKDIDTSKPLHIYGVDSLAAVEVRLWMKRSLGCEVAVFEILGNSSITELGKSLVGRCELLKGIHLEGTT